MQWKPLLIAVVSTSFIGLAAYADGPRSRGAQPKRAGTPKAAKRKAGQQGPSALTPEARNPRWKYLALGALDLRPSDPDAPNDCERGRTAVHLPDGAHVREISCFTWLKSSDDGADAQVKLKRASYYDPFKIEKLVEFDLELDKNSMERSTSGTIDHVVDNHGFTYYLVADKVRDWVIRGCRIAYTE